MNSRRGFLTGAAALAGAACLGRWPVAALAQPGQRREVTIGGRRIKTIDVHAHCVVTEVAELVRGTRLEQRIRDSLDIQQVGVGPERLKAMDADGIDVQALSVNPFWYSADHELARRIID